MYVIPITNVSYKTFVVVVLSKSFSAPAFNNQAAVNIILLVLLLRLWTELMLLLLCCSMTGITTSRARVWAFTASCASFFALRSDSTNVIAALISFSSMWMIGFLPILFKLAWPKFTSSKPHFCFLDPVTL